MVDRLPEIDVTWEQFIELREDSFDTFESIGVDRETLTSVRESARWILADRPAPEEVQAVEVKFDGMDTPLAILYSDSPATSFPRRMAEVFMQAGVDHATGHLILGAKGLERENESKACLLQYLASMERARHGDRRFALFAAAMVPGLRFHKHIPINNFSKQTQASLLAEVLES
ncbi:MAG: hypothetical protein WD603_00180 [Patescibacteria group bacterium]